MTIIPVQSNRVSVSRLPILVNILIECRLKGMGLDKESILDRWGRMNECSQNYHSYRFKIDNIRSNTSPIVTVA